MAIASNGTWLLFAESPSARRRTQHQCSFVVPTRGNWQSHLRASLVVFWGSITEKLTWWRRTVLWPTIMVANCLKWFKSKWIDSRHERSKTVQLEMPSPVHWWPFSEKKRYPCVCSSRRKNFRKWYSLTWSNLFFFAWNVHTITI